jgi:Putative DNA-binding domain
MIITKTYLDQLIADKIEESGTLEYKAAGSIGRSDGAKREITKDVSSFANAVGGTVVYGIAESEDNKHLPGKYDPIDPREFSREWMDQIIGLIQPRIAGLEIVPISVGPAVTDYCYAVIIPQSNTAHQALDLKYYKRRNFESTAMEDYEVRDVMNRRRDPTLSLKLRLWLQNDHWCLGVVATNTSTVIARFIQVIVDLPPLFNRRELLGSDGGGSQIIRDDNVQCFRIKLRNSIDQPIFAGDSKSWTVQLEQSLRLGVPPEWRQGKILRDISYRAFADQMKMIEGAFEPREIVDESAPMLSEKVLAGLEDIRITDLGS